jgi:hypothetical protein
MSEIVRLRGAARRSVFRQTGDPPLVFVITLAPGVLLPEGNLIAIASNGQGGATVTLDPVDVTQQGGPRIFQFTVDPADFSAFYGRQWVISFLFQSEDVTYVLFQGSLVWKKIEQPQIVSTVIEEAGSS